ncbi:restriction endonuclease subunit S [Streptomyces sp. SID7958]|uniref:Restriction endonuclease subunit S n=2 Tax=unclassified Streptomyces TaxID=2593676 RepID=A0A6G3QPL6_9ACTN|nr:MULTISPECIES: restriction endonuclease subunit S [unclassified Streptomyces]NEA85147.1 restriction endonuclease subunit S [Streptomyces sp. SID14436]NEC77736.1 restriction endonuclease subunit S [Streptomyces sp. SID7958]
MTEWRYVEYQEIAAQEKSAFSMGPFGSKITKENYVNTGVPVVRGVNLARGIFIDDDFVFITNEKADEIMSANVDPGDLIFTHRGTIGQVSMIPREPRFNRYVIGSSQVKTRLDESTAVPEFYYYWFRSTEGQRSILANASTVGVPGIATPLTSIRKLLVPLPPRREQEGIAAVLGALDNKVVANERIASTTDELIQELWDIHLREPGSRKTSLIDVLSITFGAPFKSSEFSSENTGRPLLRIRDLKTFTPKVWTTQRLDKETLVATGDVVAGMDAEFRPVFWLGEEALLNQRVMHVRSRIGGGSPLCREAMRGPLALVESYKTGTTVAHLNKSDLATLLVEIPSEEAVSSFESATAPLHKRLVGGAAENRTLTALRDTLLPQLMSGKLRIRDAEKIVGDAV